MLVRVNIHTHGHTPGATVEMDDELGMDLADAGLITVLAAGKAPMMSEAPVILTYLAPETDDVLLEDTEHADKPSRDGDSARDTRKGQGKNQRLGSTRGRNSLG